MKASQKAIQIIKDSESLKLKAYICPAGKLTIGYGHTKNVTPAMMISPLQAEQLLAEDVSSAEADLNKLLKKSLKQNQYDALVDFVFNLGAQKLATSTLLKMVNTNPHNALIPAEFLKWVYATNPKTGLKEKLPGLVTRREKEAKLYSL
ncbi:Lysozyme RrrD [bioreactor metagenome]|uniref:Lysozyme RrrD n=1 Tax=bioreactor metagenome TaxID=1076179 RepID=A0A645BK91_9ZZZZ